MTCTEPERETEKVEQLYEAFLQAKQTAGEATGKLSRSSFNEFVLKKTKELQKQKNCRDVEYVVEVVEGQVKLKALVKSYVPSAVPRAVCTSPISASPYHCCAFPIGGGFRA